MSTMTAAGGAITAAGGVAAGHVAANGPETLFIIFSIVVLLYTLRKIG